MEKKTLPVSYLIILKKSSYYCGTPVGKLVDITVIQGGKTEILDETSAEWNPNS